MEDREEVLDLKESLQELIDAESWSDLTEEFDNLHVQDIALVVGDQADADARCRVYRQVPKERWVATFSYLPPNQQEELLFRLNNREGRFILLHLLPDDRTALLERLPPEDTERLLKLLPPADVKLALRLLNYPEESVGRLMTPHYTAVRPDWAIAEALAHIRQESRKGETVNTILVTDENDGLIDAIKLKTFLLGEPEDLVDSIRPGYFVSVEASEDREAAVRAMQHYDLEVLPVTDRDGILLGIVTVDDVMDVVQEETTEDFQKMGSVGAFTDSLRNASPALLYRKRVGWLVALVFINIFSGAAIAVFESTIEAVIALVFFLPMIVASGGNAGAQASTLMVRALATGDVAARDWLALLLKEIVVGVALGLTMGLAVSLIGLWRGGPEVALVVALAMVMVVIMGSLVGMLMPFILSRMNLDPATASVPLITCIADIGGILIYFSVATALLTLPPPGA
ncbi:magnesium transporter [Natronocella acetinitrilica]|uniref:Magnesium transporter MgtE n=1 Tax=Natronocella acetinitrilica TaxID=414046 RepID=A0AAE3G4V6_9GAMM|nr:magnesium transporter [Natronocella acetinitrilica]MCP1675188.1 magnesium transporter [Natronocella acetinitrilica]